MKTKRFITDTACHILLAILSVIWVLPILFVVLTSFRKESGSYKTYIWPKGFTLDNYKNLITGHSNIDFSRWFLNTLIIAIFSTLISAFFVLCVSYCMSRLRFKMRKTFMNIALIMGMFPGFMSMIAVYYILKGLGLLETGQLKQVALVMVYSGGAGLGFYMAKGFFDTISKSIDEAAYIDGASKWETCFHIAVPEARPLSA
ncbi:MAG: ABC transporter permease subunit, partial [Lachnospiraceae bacterium]|nr:ABC transporter permease subunit [Lachnospiraceae bacterium]